MLVPFSTCYQGDESHKADEYIRFIKDKLEDGVKQCLLAAAEEFDVQVQQCLLMVRHLTGLC